MREEILARRSIAAIIDLAVCCFLFWLVFHLFGRPVDRGGMSVRVLSGWPALFLPTAWLFYFPYTEACLHRTLGKLVCGLKVVRVDGGRLSFKQTFLRRLLDPLEIWFAFGLVGWILVAASENGRRLGDKLGDTRVIRNKAVQLDGAPNDGPSDPARDSVDSKGPPSVT
ncbi:MAG TPA: RDD family protein [Clostridia bacterium]|nr:RDD family protein [Clostridia bacterium]